MSVHPAIYTLGRYFFCLATHFESLSQLEQVSFSLHPCPGH